MKSQGRCAENPFVAGGSSLSCSLLMPWSSHCQCCLFKTFVRAADSECYSPCLHLCNTECLPHSSSNRKNDFLTETHSPLSVPTGICNTPYVMHILPKVSDDTFWIGIHQMGACNKHASYLQGLFCRKAFKATIIIYAFVIAAWLPLNLWMMPWTALRIGEVSVVSCAFLLFLHA